MQDLRATQAQQVAAPAGVMALQVVRGRRVAIGRVQDLAFQPPPFGQHIREGIDAAGFEDGRRRHQLRAIERRRGASGQEQETDQKRDSVARNRTSARG